ncbi:hypothetical protein EUGRSUZ_G03354 [Eucalyptus grandis]|uniref:Uncharacterized protein n=1 Tax=Eucalyptus grandis TaxID=71139 RepID=A0ACC3K9D3_EUCGR|nr:hypothetical protein EUGRSUZ_G03354 [Eucalyptus grandis]
MDTGLTPALSTEYVLRTVAFDHTGKQYSSSEEMKQLVDRVYLSPDGQWVASASFDRSLKLCNGIIGKFVAAFSGHVGPVYQISWSADSRLILSGSKDYPEDLGYSHEEVETRSSGSYG